MVQTGASHSTTTKSAAARTTAVMMRVFSTLGSIPQLPRRETEPALAVREVRERGLELGQVELGPEAFAEVELRVREVPEQEIADAPLAAGADEEIRIRQAVERERFGEQAFVDVAGGELAASAPLRERARRLHEVPASAVAHGDLQLEAAVARRESFRGGHAGDERGRETTAVADEAKPHALFVKLRDLPVQRVQEQREEARDLLRRTLPVLAREREERQRLDAA